MRANIQQGVGGSTMIRFILFCGLMLHVAVAVWNGFFGPSLGAEGDALRFHEEAIYFSNNLGQFEYVTGWIYAYFLGFLYRIFTDHLFFGSMISVFAWLWSAIIIKQIMEMINQSPKQTAIVLIFFCMWPSVLFNTSVTLRESFQVLAVNLMAYSVIRLIVKNKLSWLPLIGGMALGSVLHGTLLIFSSAVFFYVLYHIAGVWLRLETTGRVLFVMLFGSAGLALGVFLLGNIAYNIDKGILDTVRSFNESAATANARADYRAPVYFSGILDFILFVPSAFFQYMMEPLPSRIGSIPDAALFLENLVRAALFLVAAIGIFRKNTQPRVVPVFLFVAYVFLSLVWSIGSINWGTASRHHVPGLGLLLIAAFFASPSSERGRIENGPGQSRIHRRKDAVVPTSAVVW
jgi:hypothetical protein